MRALIPRGRRHLAVGVNWMDNGSLTVKGLVLGRAESWQKTGLNY
jgi:hypothetical protein